MAIEQSRTSGNEVRSQAAKGGANAVGRSKPMGTEEGASNGLGFAAVLAATDAASAPSGDACANATPCEATVDRGRSDAAGEGRTPPPVVQDTPVPPADGKFAEGRDTQTSPWRRVAADADMDSLPGATQAERSPVDVLLQGLLPPQAEGGRLVVPGSVDGATAVEGAPLSLASGGVGRGVMKTNQLQQTLAVGKVDASTVRATASTDASVAMGGQGAAASASSQAMAGDLRPVVGGRSPAGPQALGAEVASTPMGTMAWMASQPDRAGREWRGPEEARGGGAAVLEGGGAETTDVAEQLGAGQGMEEQPVQETVRYWIGADSKQQAELTVQDVAGGAVDVTIYMQGKEAQVSFRADQQQARDALQSASGHLEQLLGKEGLTLSGLSVETSSAGQDGRRDQRQGAGKTAKVAGVEAPLAQPSTHVGSAGSGIPGRGKTLDLFV